MKPTVYIETTIPSYLAEKRRECLKGIPLLDVTDATTRLAQRFLSSRLIPAGAETDAVHIGVAAVHGIHFLLTWNCTHIANAALTDRLRTICSVAGYALPVICTPEELMEL